MCSPTPDLTTALAQLELAALEAEVIALEADAGWSIPGATRPLLPHEVRAQVRFGDLDRMAEEAAGLIARHAGRVHDAAVAALLVDLAAHAGSPAALLARLNDLTSPTSAVRLPLDDVLAAVRADVVDALEAVRHAAAGELLSEAARQGIPADLLPRQVAITEAERAGIVASARRVAEAPLLRVLDVAGKEARARAVANTDPGAVVQTIDTSVNAISPAGVRDEARRAAQRSINAGREAAAQEAPEPEEVYASELLDGNTCGPCADVDGRMYATLDDALADYPSGGSYLGCLGGDRCRGTLVFVWPTEQAPTVDGSDTIDRTPRGPTGVPRPAHVGPDGKVRPAPPAASA